MSLPPLPGPELDARRRDVALACRVLASEGLVSGILGHVSLRVAPGLLLVRARPADDQGLLLTRPSDVVLADLEGEPAEELAGRVLPQELPIHTGVLRQRADVSAVVHAHPPDVVACTIAGLLLQPIVGAFNIPAMRLAERGIPTMAYYGLVRDRRRAEEMVAAMAGGPVVLLRGHGLTAAAPTLAGAVVTALNVDALAAMTVSVARAGRSAPLVPEADRAGLPDLGSGFNDGLVWGAHLAKLAHLGLGIPAAPEAPPA